MVRATSYRLLLACLMLAGSPAASAEWYWQDLFLTRDQQGLYFYRQQQFARAARRFENPHWRALASYANQDFETAVKLWSRLPGAEPLFNRGNALAQQKQYKAAADSYKLALQLRPNWQEARDNLSLVQALAKTPPEPDDANAQTDGESPADEVRFDKDNKRLEQAEATPPSDTSGKEIQALWLSRLQSTPADFLRLKFRYQANRQSSHGEDRP